MTTLNESQVKQAETLKKFRPAIQAWMDENVTDSAKPVSAKLIYNALHEPCKLTMNEQSFQVLLSLNVKGGFIQGFYGKKGIGGGYLPGVKPEGTTEAKVDLNLASATDLGNGMTLGRQDDQWVISGNGSPLFFNSLTRAVNHAQSHVVEEELKKLTGDLTLADVMVAIREAGEHVAARIKSVMAASVPVAEAEVVAAAPAVTVEAETTAPAAEETPAAEAAPKRERKARNKGGKKKTEAAPAQEAESDVTEVADSDLVTE